MDQSYGRLIVVCVFKNNCNYFNWILFGGSIGPNWNEKWTVRFGLQEIATLNLSFPWSVVLQGSMNCRKLKILGSLLPFSSCQFLPREQFNNCSSTKLWKSSFPSRIKGIHHSLYKFHQENYHFQCVSAIL